MPSELISLLIQIPLVAAFMWFVLELGKRSDATLKEMDSNAIKTVEVQTARYMEALALQNDQNKATINELNERYLTEIKTGQENFSIALDTMRKHYEEALMWRDAMLKEQREADRASIKEIVAAISRMATILDKHDKDTSEAITAMKERTKVLDAREVQSRSSHPKE